MTIQALRVLHFLKKVQHKESYEINIDLEVNLATRVMDGYEWGPRFDLSPMQDYWRSALRYLLEKKLVIKRGSYALQLTHSGYHYWQTVLSAVLRFLLTSIAVPIVVAAATTLVTLWLQGVFTAVQ